MNKFKMEIFMENDIEILYTTIPDLQDITWYLEELSEHEEFDLDEVTEIKIYTLKK